MNQSLTPSAGTDSKTGSSKAISLQDYLDLSTLVFEWADSYDAKDWARLRAILAPALYVDYTKIGKEKWDAMSADDFMAMVSNDDFLGDPCVKTQHLIGATYWERVSESKVIGHHQLRAAHQVYTSPDLKTVKLRGHSHATNEHYYVKSNGVWKFAGLKPEVRWNEYKFEEVFKGSYTQSEKHS
ncbi:Scytalone dehydratase-like protein Arp1 [Metarhizium brunneum]|uniref:Scytalone dehydratase-like protein Arp1 n=1 Tax=Metarhizium brunneum TaxID=500148 RepID=A0A7D5Z7E0_9HYPO|nr:Scytalone dehydratase-like protein Arp1 [Metarhizium brunneum]